MSSSDLAVGAAQRAVEHTKRHLFPFDFGKWLGLGFLAFLDQCGRGGGGMPQFPSGGGPQLPSGSGGDTGRLDEATAWLATHAVIVGAIVLGVLVLVVALGALVQWINARGVFMYVDAVARGQADIGRAWRETAGAAWSYFLWTFGLGLAILAFLLVTLGGGGVGVVLLLRGGGGPLPWLLLAGLVLLLFVVVLASSLTFLALRDFVAPIQIASGLPCAEAVRRFVVLLRANLGAFVIYVLLKIAFAIALGMVTCLAMCLTCCLAAIPVITQTVLQPIFFFERAWSLFLLRSLGVDVFPPEAPPAV